MMVHYDGYGLVYQFCNRPDVSAQHVLRKLLIWPSCFGEHYKRLAGSRFYRAVWFFTISIIAQRVPKSCSKKRTLNRKI